MNTIKVVTGAILLISAGTIGALAQESTRIVLKGSTDETALINFTRDNAALVAAVQDELKKEKPFEGSLNPLIEEHLAKQKSGAPLDPPDSFKGEKPATYSVKVNLGFASAGASTTGFVLTLKNVAEFHCETDWNGSCSDEITYTPPEGWEICRFHIFEDSISKGTWNVAVANPTRIVIQYSSRGSHRFYDRWGAWVHGRIAEVYLMAASLSPAAKAKCACDYGNQRGGVAGQLVEIRCIPVHNGPYSLQLCRDFVFEGSSKRYLSEPYLCGFCNYDSWNPR